VIDESQSDEKGANGDGLSQNRSTGRLLWTFLKDVFFAAAIFFIIAAAAVAMNLIGTYLDSFGVNEALLWGLKATEYLILTIDLVLFITYVLKSALSLAREL